LGKKVIWIIDYTKRATTYSLFPQRERVCIPESYFPLQINTKEDTVYNLHFSNRDAFYMSAMAHKTSKLGLGTARKQMVISCNTNQELIDLMNSFVWE
jgi:hypothetical protein